MNTMCVQENQKWALDPLELELQVVLVTWHEWWDPDLGLLERQLSHLPRPVTEFLKTYGLHEF